MVGRRGFVGRRFSLVGSLVADDFEPHLRSQPRQRGNGRQPGGRQHHKAASRRAGRQGNFEEHLATLGTDAQRMHVTLGNQRFDLIDQLVPGDFDLLAQAAGRFMVLVHVKSPYVVGSHRPACGVRRHEPYWSYGQARAASPARARFRPPAKALRCR